MRARERVNKQVFNGSLDSLRNSWRVHGIGQNRASEINYWVIQKKRELPRIINGDFSGKTSIVKRFDTKIYDYELKIRSKTRDRDNLLVVKKPVQESYAYLSKTTKSTFVKSYNGDKESSEQIMDYHLGAFLDWYPIPDWFKKAEKYL
jgi:hypothetical protein